MPLLYCRVKKIQNAKNKGLGMREVFVIIIKPQKYSCLKKQIELRYFFN